MELCGSEWRSEGSPGVKGSLIFSRDPWGVLHAPGHIAVAIRWVWGRWSSAVRAQVLLDGKRVLDLEVTNVWQTLRRTEPGLSCARKLAAKQKGAVEVC